MTNRGGPDAGDNRNMILAIVLSVVVLLAFEFLVGRPQREQEVAARRATEIERSIAAPSETAAAAPATRESALAETAGRRIPIQTPRLSGTLLLNGARLDDLSLTAYRRTITDGSPNVTLLVPRDSVAGETEEPAGADAYFGWEARDAAAPIADTTSPWQAPAGARLTPESPLTLTLDAGGGLVLTRTISIDRNFMFTIEDTVRNDGPGARDLRPYGVVRRQNRPPDFFNSPIVHQGMSGVFGPDHRLHEVRYERGEDHARDKTRGRTGAEERIEEETGEGGWLGLSDHYWLSALVPAQGERVDAWYDARNERQFTDFRAAYRGQWRTLQPGQEIAYTQNFYAGAKRVDMLRTYQRELSLPDFDKAVDWGNFFFLTRPFFELLHFLGRFAGNFGLGILLTTIVVRFVLFPLVYQSNVAMTKMRKLQPKMKEIQERFGADKPRQQQEMIKLYQTEKINPLAGCLPILLQIPVFYALYKTLTVTIEMRHTPFFGWIQDLSARDPTNLFNAFGLLPMIGLDVTALPLIGAFLHLGVWPILYGVSMWALQALSPPPTDPTQAMVFRYLPLLFTFLFAGFAAGLVIYWTWSNVLMILQQYVIMRRMGVETELDKLLAKRFGKKESPGVAE